MALWSRLAWHSRSSAFEFPSPPTLQKQKQESSSFSGHEGTPVPLPQHSHMSDVIFTFSPLGKTIFSLESQLLASWCVWQSRTMSCVCVSGGGSGESRWEKHGKGGQWSEAKASCNGFWCRGRWRCSLWYQDAHPAFVLYLPL